MLTNTDPSHTKQIKINLTTPPSTPLKPRHRQATQNCLNTKKTQLTSSQHNKHSCLQQGAVAKQQHNNRLIWLHHRGVLTQNTATSSLPPTKRKSQMGNNCLQMGGVPKQEQTAPQQTPPQKSSKWEQSSRASSAETKTCHLTRVQPPRRKRTNQSRRNTAQPSREIRHRTSAAQQPNQPGPRPPEKQPTSRSDSPLRQSTAQAPTTQKCTDQNCVSPGTRLKHGRSPHQTTGRPTARRGE